MAASPTDALVKLALAKLGADTPTAQSILRLAVVLAQDANKLPGLRGKERLELVLSALRRVIEVPTVKEKLGADAEKILKDVIDNVVPETIALVVEASRGGFALKKPTVGCVASLAVLLCRLTAASAPAGSEIAVAATAAAAVASTVATAAEEPAAVAAVPSVAVPVPSVELAAVPEHAAVPVPVPAAERAPTPELVLRAPAESKPEPESS